MISSAFYPSLYRAYRSQFFLTQSKDFVLCRIRVWWTFNESRTCNQTYTMFDL